MEIASRKLSLSMFLGKKSSSVSTVLDYGGDRGQFIPEHLGTRRFVFELSDASPVKGVERIQSVEGRTFDFVMLAHVLEHCSEPRHMLQLLIPLAHENTLFYFEVPLERPSVTWVGKGKLQMLYMRTLIRFKPLFQLVDLYSTIGRVKLDIVPPLGILKCSEHLNFFNKQSLQALLASERFELIDSGVAPLASRGPVSNILYGLARVLPNRA